MYIAKISKDDIDILVNLNEIIFKDFIKYSRDYITKVCNQRLGYIIRFNNIPAGYVFCDTYNNEIEKKAVPTIMSIGVLEEFRKLGFGRSLVKLAVELYENQDVYLYVRENSAAQDLYVSEGFIIIGNIKGYYKLKSGDENANIMVRFHEMELFKH